MSFKSLDKDQLIAAADEFGTDIDKRWGEQNIITALLNDGITWDMYLKSFPPAQPDVPEPEPVVPEPEASKPDTTKKFSGKEKVELMKMERLNPSFQILTYKFTKSHPFALVKADDAQWILQNATGFRIATPQEAEEFYK